MSSCVHYFIIQEANERPTSPGVCQRCGERRTFNNSIADDDGSWRDMEGKKLNDKQVRRQGQYA